MEFVYWDEAPSPVTDEEVRDNAPLWAEIRGRFPTLSHEKSLELLGLILNTCTSCRKNGSGCQCWNDE